MLVSNIETLLIIASLQTTARWRDISFTNKSGKSTDILKAAKLLYQLFNQIKLCLALKAKQQPNGKNRSKLKIDANQIAQTKTVLY